MIKVYLQYPWKFPDSSYYKYLTEYPPEGVKFVNTNFGVSNREGFYKSNKLKQAVRSVVRGFKLPMPNAHLTKTNDNYDLIHCAHCLSLNKQPWVADIETPGSLWVTGKLTTVNKFLVQRIILSDHCKKLMPWTFHTKLGIESQLGNKRINEKLEVVYPAVPYEKIKAKKRSVTVFFASRYFWIKGGLYVLEVMKRLKQKYDINAIVISDVPEELKKKYEMLQIMDIQPYEETKRILSQSDIFLYPSFSDTFGFAQIEAMSFGAPIVTVDDMQARKEIVTDGKTGFVIDPPKNIAKYFKPNYNLEERIVKDLVAKTSELIENTSLRKKMSKTCTDEIKTGKFSMEQRNKQLKRIYEEAIRM